MSIFKSSPSSCIGVDIGTTSIKAVELVRSGKGVVTVANYGILETAGYLERFNSALQTSSLKLLDTDVVEYLRILVGKMNVRTTEAVASLPAFSAFTTLLELPVMGNREITQSINFQAKNYIPLPISTVTIDWLKVGEKIEPDGTKKEQVLLISVPNDLVEMYSGIFRQAGLHLTSLEIEGLSAARVITTGVDKPTLIVDIGGRSTAISVARNGGLKFAGQTDFSSGSLTQALSTALNIGNRRAEDLKRQTMLIGQGGERELSTIMLPLVDVIINEVKRIQSGFESGYRESIAGIVLCGSGANMLGLPEYVSAQMRLPVTLANPFAVVNYPPEIEALKKDLGPTLTVAIGVGLKNFT